MSVIHFGCEELGNVAVYLARDKWQAGDDLKWLAEQLAAYSVGNAAAYNYRYSDGEAKGCSAGEILAAAISLQEDHKLSADSARGTLRLLSYNGPEGEGLVSFRGRAAYYQAMTLLLARAYSYLLREVESRTRNVPGAEHY